MSTQSPRYSYGFSPRYVICKVVNRDDPEQSGRLQVRVVGYQDDEGTIPDEQLHWARPLFPVNNPMNGGVGGPVTGAQVNSYFIGFYADADGQQLLLQHSMGKAGEDNGGGQLDQSGRKHDTNKHSRDEDKEGGDYRFDKDKDDYDSQSITKYAKDEAPNPYGRKHSKDGDENPQNSWSLGQYQY